MALVVACEVHPIQNLRVLNYVKATYNQTDEQVNKWAQHWIDLGLAALQEMIVAQPKRGKFCFGDVPTLADVCLLPQLGNARRYGCDLSKYPTILEIEKNCSDLPLPMPPRKAARRGVKLCCEFRSAGLLSGFELTASSVRFWRRQPETRNPRPETSSNPCSPSSSS